MLPRKLRIGITLALLLFCASSGYARAAFETQREGPLNCYTCNSVSECAASLGALRKCENNDAQTCVTIFSAANEVAQRTCSDGIDEQYKSYCGRNPDKCPSCISTGCNDATSYAAYSTCVACTTVEDAKCSNKPGEITTTKLCNGGCLTALYQSEPGANWYQVERSCLNDRDLDEREECLAGSDPHCIGCEGQNCNVHIMPQNEHTCYHCSGEDCDEPVVKACVAADEELRCYTQFNERIDVVGMGCATALGTTTQIDNLVKEKLLLVCEGNNCNGYENMPTANLCAECDSATDEACATRPNIVSTQKSCITLPYTQCYERVNSGGSTQRGCLHELASEEFFNCLKGGDANCRICNGESCNAGTIPADRMQCQRCNSDTNANCHRSPTAVTSCPRYEPDDKCVAVYLDGVTKRGCSSEFSCDATKKNCEICSDNGCNTINLKRRFDGINGIFQDLPLNCYTCEGTDCTVEYPNLRKCDGDEYQDCMTVFDAAGAVVRRGCEDLVESTLATYCETNPALCVNCKANGCNTVTNVANIQECIYCDTSNNEQCLLEPSTIETKRKCAEGCMTALYESTAEPKTQQLVRACFEDIELDDREICIADGSCVKCTDSDNCNTIKLPAETEHLTCLHCDGADCNMPTSQTCTANADDDQCYIYFDNTFSAVRMGCKSSLPRGTLPAEIKNYFLCDGDDCNDFKNLPEAHMCFVCDSNTNEDCAINPAAIKGQTRCQNNPHTDCYTRIGNAGQTVRGCVWELSTEEFLSCHTGDPEGSCRICTESDCNQNIYPANRQRCHQCNSADDPACEKEPNAAGVCTLYDPKEYCVSKLEKGVTMRGCSSKLSCADGENCEICGESNCNTHVLVAATETESLSCLHCDGADCNMPTSQSCTTEAENDQCYIYFEDVTHSAVRMGCKSSLPTETLPAEIKNYFLCDGDDCNDFSNLPEANMCFVCDSSTDVNCATNPTAIKAQTRCQINPHTDCYTRIGDAGQTIRGCVWELSTEEFLSCHNGDPDDVCRICTESDCNRNIYPSSRQRCHQCNSADDPACEKGPNAAGVCELFDPNEFCVSKLENGVTMRDCSSKLSCDDAEKCETCEESNCNTHVLVAANEGLSCLHCDGADCNMPTSQSCTTEAENDQCYIYFEDVTHSAVRMGCKSSLPTETLPAEIKNYFLCDGDDCNDFSNLPEANMCFVCDSSTDVNCATNPTAIKAQTRCQINPHTDCYTRIGDAGQTIRGCVWELSTEEFLSCHLGDPSDFCRICTESDCNRNIYPSSRQRCHQCNSADDPTCEKQPNASGVCALFDPKDVCVSKLENGVTTRGCSSELKCGGAEKCESCEKNNCNTDVLVEEDDIGKPGIFQGLPLNCYHCDSLEDCSGEVGNVNKCEGNIYQTCSTAFNTAGKVVGRGCSALMESTCHGADTTCYECKSNGCNTATAETDYIDCIYCDAQENAACIFKLDDITKTRKCHKSCITALYPRTQDLNPVYELIRTCADDMDLDDRELCIDGKTASCKACTTANCNTDELATELHKSCYHCTGDDCQSPEVQTCRAIADPDQCFIQYDETSSIVEMGCKSKYDPAEVKLLVTEKRLWLCDEDNCNTIENLPTTQTCTICSSVTDEACALAPNTVQSTTSCASLPYTQCYTRLLESGHTERGCLSSNQGDDFYDCLNAVNKTGCVSCTGAKCNLEIFPEDRLSCYQCNSMISSSCETAPESQLTCLKYTAGERCVTSINDLGHTLRGCSSQINCDPKDTANCRICDSDNCNSLNLKRKSDGKPGIWQELPLTCQACDNKENCAVGSRDSACFGDAYCMTVFGEDGAVIKRGCSDAVESELGTYCDSNSANCLNCNSNSCNRAVKLDDYIDCIYCDGETNTNCVGSAADVGGRRKCHNYCMTALRPRSAGSDILELTRSCLDDKDVADQQECLEGSNLCKACNDANCNVDILPADRLSCFSCVGDDCEDPAEEACSTYKLNDQCFMLFDEASTIQRMGCASDLEDSFVNNNIHLLYLCSGEYCNDFGNIPKPKICATCGSAEDENCAIDPESIPAVAQCRSLPHTECYTRVNTDGTTDRGCLSSLSKTVIANCLSGDSATCQICEGDRCNIKVYPDDRRRCHRCNTKEDPACEFKPQASAICPLYSADERCSVKLVNDHTYRGCSSDFQCDETDKQYCRMCAGADDCNIVDLVSTSIGYPGKWQDVPISCHTCKGAECKDAVVKSSQCVGNDLQNCGTVFDASGTVVQRGCSDAIYADEYATYCDANPGSCKFCKSNDCNTAASLSDFVDCLYCDTDENGDCVVNVENIKRTRSCHQKCLTALYPRTSEANPIYELARGCLDDLDAADRAACESGDKTYCKACSGASCNKDIMPETRKKCFVCAGDECEEPSSQICASFREQDQCFALFDKDTNSAQRLGCASDLDASFIEENKRQLFFCDRDECNIFNEFPTSTSCRTCNSIDNPECATNPNVGTATTCSNLPYTGCYTHVNKVGVTYRGCLSDVANDLFDECLQADSTTCALCDINNCNNQVYPDGRRSCHRCSSKDDSTCEDNPSQFASICPIYEEADKCVTKLDGNHILRGCSSDFTCDPSDRDTCRVCSSDNCNSVNLLAGYVGEPGKWQGLPLNCYVCEGSDCATGSSAHKCEGNNLQTCITVFDVDGEVTSRGCSDTVTEAHANYCEENPDKCIACKSNGCNNADSLDVFIDCYVCDSADSDKCSIEFDGNGVRTRKCQKSCMAALYPRTSVDNPAYEMSRSCLDDMDADDQEACANGERKYCSACVGARCNTMSVPDERHSCYKCSNGNCEDFFTQECSAHQEEDQCYILFDEESSVAGMGCRSEFELDVITDLVKQKRVILCEGENCNMPEIIPTPKQCSVCNSETDPLCATNPNLIGYTERCASLPYTECYTRVTDNGHTTRGCLSSLPSDTFYNCLIGNDKLCETCTGDKCNEIDVFPADRMKCHQCSSATDPLCSTAPASNKVCPIFAEKDTCVTNLRNGITTRGCSSSMKCDNESDKRTCRTCSTAGCNTINLEKVSEDGEPGRWQGIPLTCYTCVGEEACESGGDFRVCDSNPYQNCMTVFNADGKVIQRGCSEHVEEENQEFCDANAGSCLGCNSNGCNFPDSLDDYIECLFCDTDSNGNCVNNVADISKTRKCYKHCMTALYPKYDEENPAYGLSRSCYDDMDMDDRDACEANNKENCQVCSESKCNSIAMPEKRLSCNICSGDDCQDPKPTQCATYRDGDKCYLQFDEQRAIVAMGCRSEFSNADADYLLKQKRLYLCDGDDCNTIENLPVAQTCALCNSRTDTSCATNPTSLNSLTNCAILPYTECYTRVLSNGATERGCLTNLYDDEFVSCLDGSSATCSACKGNNCNNEVYPEGRTSCHICDSTADPLCEAFPLSESICPKYDAEETCVTVYRNDVTYRGCSSSLECDENDPKKCVKCSGNACNTVNLAKKQDDNFGKWQDLPLSCLTCSGAECESTEEPKAQTCENNNQQDCVTVFDEAGKVAARGCSDAIEVEYGGYCDANVEDCYNCKSNECNTATAKTDFSDCIYCDTHKDQNCLWNPLSDAHSVRKCQGGCMTALYPSDGSSDPTYDLIRTCLNDKEKAGQTTCSNGRDSQCKACTDSKCNDDDLPEDRLSCYTCEDESCEEPEEQICPLYKKDDKCYIWFDNANSITQMGCLSSFRNQDLATIVGTKRILLCDGDKCNTIDILPKQQKCAVCDSNSDYACATSANDIGTFNTCNQMPYTSCYTKIISSDGSTARGCLTDLPGADFAACVLGSDENCDICTEEGCNREIFPADRQQCYTCSSEDETDCESFPTRKQPCPYLTSTESCKTALSGNVTVRGCSSELLCDSGDWRSCRSCIGTGCNSIDLRNKVDDDYHGVWQDLPLRCHTCVGEHCLHSLGPAYSCANNIEQDCMTVFNDAGEVVRRGCSDAVEDYEDLYCREHPDLCFKCKSNECNFVWDIKDYVECVFCNSTTDPLCAINPENAGFASRLCNKECLVAMKDGQTVRSCLDDKELNTQHVCRANSNGIECATCEQEKCNNFVYPKDRLKCHVCTGSSCTNSVGQYCELYEASDFCFAKYENGQVELMGCGSAQSKNDLELWETQKKLYRCDENECNDLVKLPKSDVCLSCDSSKTPECAQNPLQVTSTDVCNAPNAQCVTSLDSAGHTLRGCLSSLSQQEQNSCVAAGTCAVCSGEKCNREVFPSDRRKCYICNSVADERCEKSPSEFETQICAKYAANDQCVARNTNDYIERGCASSDLMCDATDEKYCQVCDSDGCNTADVSGAATVASSILMTLLLAFVATTLMGKGH